MNNYGEENATHLSLLNPYFLTKSYDAIKCRALNANVNILALHGHIWNENLI